MVGLCVDRQSGNSGSQGAVRYEGERSIPGVHPCTQSLHRVMAWEQGALNNQDRQGSGLFQERQPRFRNVPEKEDQLPPGGPRRSWAGLRHWVGPVTG